MGLPSSHGHANLGAVFALVGIARLATMWFSSACVGAILALLFAKSLSELDPFMLLFLYLLKYK